MGICAVRVNFVAAIIIIRSSVYDGAKCMELQFLKYFIGISTRLSRVTII